MFPLSAPRILLLILGVMTSIVTARATFDDYLVEALTASTTGIDGSWYQTLNFTVHDPDPITNATTDCSTRWILGSAPPAVWVDCLEDTTFGFQVLEFININEFTLEIRHSFKDPSVGQPPMDVVTTFAKGLFSEPENLQCSGTGSEAVDISVARPREWSCVLAGDVPVSLPIYAAIA